MTHEPDCLAGQHSHDHDWYCSCVEVAAAYQRGREDAAKAVVALLPAGHVDGSEWLERELAIAAARGDGECQHEWDHLKGEKCETCQRCGAARGDGERSE